MSKFERMSRTEKTIRWLVFVVLGGFSVFGLFQLLVFGENNWKLALAVGGLAPVVLFVSAWFDGRAERGTDRSR